MPKGVSIFAVATAITLAGCGDKKEALCRSDITSQLLNPETVEFHDAKRMTPIEAVNDVLPEPAPLTDAEKQTSPMNRIRILDEKKAIVQKRLDMLNSMKRITEAKPDVEIYSFRVRSEGNLGNKITNQSICMNFGEKCTCKLG